MDRNALTPDKTAQADTNPPALTAKPQTFRTGDGWSAYNLAANLALRGSTGHQVLYLTQQSTPRRELHVQRTRQAVEARSSG